MTDADSPKKKKRAASTSSKGRTSFKPVVQKPMDKKLDDAPIRAKSDDASIRANDAEIKAEIDAEIRAEFDKALDLSDNVQKYIKDRTEILQVEEKNAWDRGAKPQATTEPESEDVKKERRAAAIILAVREYERRVTFGNVASEAIPGPDTQDMGGQFLTNKKRIEESKLYEIAKMVPKGALLHLHFNSELDPRQLLRQARNMEHMYIRSIRPLLTQKDLNLTETVLSALDDSGKTEPDADIFSSGYLGNATNWKEDKMKWKVWMRWSDFQKKFEEKIKEGTFDKKYEHQEDKIVPQCCSEPTNEWLQPAENWLKSKMILSEEEAYGSTQTVNGVWARFNQATRCFKGLLNYEEVYKWYINEAIDCMIKEKVMYAELRPMLLDKSIPGKKGKGEVTIAQQMQLIIDSVARKKKDLTEKGQLEKFPFGLKIIYCTPRSIPKKMMQEEMKQCIILKKQFPDLICGFDLVGAEDRPNHIGYYKEEFVAFQKTCDAMDLKIPFLFHAGETLLDTGGSTDPSNSNLYDAVLLKAKRIGHGYSLMKHPHLIEKFKSQDICIELCPISNELLHLCRNIKEHPFPELLAAGIPCTLNSDNPSLFTNSMNHEFYQVMVGAPTISLYSWKQLARWSIEYSCLTDSDKEEGRRIHDDDWKKFCKHVTDRYECLMDEDNQINGEAYSKLPPFKES